MNNEKIIKKEFSTSHWLCYLLGKADGLDEAEKIIFKKGDKK